MTPELEATIRKELNLPADTVLVFMDHTADADLDSLLGPFGRAFPPQANDNKPADPRRAARASFVDFLDKLGRRGISGRLVQSEHEQDADDGTEVGAQATPSPATQPVPESGDERYQRQRGAIDEIVQEVKDALYHAITKHRGMNSPHEGYAVIKEELEELWDEIKADGGGRDDASREEALQVAAMAIRYVLDLDPSD